MKIKNLEEYIVLFFIVANSRKDGMLYSKLNESLEGCLNAQEYEKIDQIISIYFKNDIITSVGHDIEFDEIKKDRELILVATQKGQQLFDENKSSFYSQMEKRFESIQ